MTVWVLAVIVVVVWALLCLGAVAFVEHGARKKTPRRPR